MALWTDLIDPAEVVGIARAEQYMLEQRRGTLAHYLPNVFVNGDTIKFFVGENGLVDEAQLRSWNAAPEIGKSGGGSMKSISLVAISRNEPIDEQTQKALRRMTTDQFRKSVTAATRRTVQSISDRVERIRGSIINTGKATVTQHNYLLNDDFGRDPALNVALGAGNWWDTGTADRFAQIRAHMDIYRQKNDGNDPGRICMNASTLAALAGGNQFRTTLNNGANINATSAQAASMLLAEGLPAAELYNRRTKSGLVLDPKKIYYLPDPVDPNGDTPSDLGATYWGETVSGMSQEFNLEPGEQPGLVVGVYREDRIPYTLEVMGDAVALPVARNANAAMAVQVLP